MRKLDDYETIQPGDLVRADAAAPFWPVYNSVGFSPRFWREHIMNDLAEWWRPGQAPKSSHAKPLPLP